MLPPAVRSGLLNKRNIAIGAGVILVVMVAIVAVAVGLGNPDVPSDDVAVVEADINVPGLISDGKISKEGFDKLLDQTAKQQGLTGPPPPNDPQYKAIKDQTLSTALDIAWIEGEAQKRDVSVTGTEVQQEFETTKKQNFKTEAEYQKFLQQSGLTEDEVLQRVRLQLVSTKIQDDLTKGVPAPSDSDAQSFYDSNKAQYEQPEKRNIRLIVNQDPQQVQAALAALQKDSSDASWQKVAAQFSTDPQSKDKGGARQEVVPGTFEQPLDDDIFNASQGELTGPLTTPTGTYIFRVDSITPGSTQPFDQVKDQIKQQIQQQQQQEAFSAFLNDYRDYWVDRTVCGDDYLTVRCDNFTGNPSPCPSPDLTPEQQQQQLQQQGCPPPVLTISPAAPGSVRPFVPATGGAPQKPHPAGADTDTAGTSGLVPSGGAGGTPVVPGQ
jgi:foldase protein PrsA